MGAEHWLFVDFPRQVIRPDIRILFSGWTSGEEHLGILSPHDDDALLGAGYLILAAVELGARVTVYVGCDGSGGYSTPEERDRIVAVRRKETLDAYRHLGLESRDLVRFDLPDWSLGFYTGWKLPRGGEGLAARLLEALRRRQITRLLLPNGFREHLDHQALHDLGRYVGAQAGDAILADHGSPHPISTMLVYSVWSDFPPVRPSGGQPSDSLRADKGLLVPDSVEDRILQAVRCFGSQKEIIDALVAQRRERKVESSGFLELYQTFDPRPRLQWEPYRRRLAEIVRRATREKPPPPPSKPNGH